ncbi:C2 and GRAM domain-containing protein At1g03370-like [Miscanthus floridulus]|uniref:C2 and GRAM domain-containing protein At1g03370-like n=1 Tax=Miscanthus floridulus TaxID=154761 RepID=UPI0034587B65
MRDPYAKAQLGKQRAKTKVVRKTLCPAWDEEFAFRVGDLRDNLLVSVLHEDRYFADDVLGQVKEKFVSAFLWLKTTLKRRRHLHIGPQMTLHQIQTNQLNW